MENLHTDSNGMIGKSPCFGVNADNNNNYVDEESQPSDKVTPADKIPELVIQDESSSGLLCCAPSAFNAASSGMYQQMSHTAESSIITTTSHMQTQLQNGSL